ncbi:MAG: hypothetical protein HXK95_002255 [Candidatus Nanogingivalaceae bacterium]|nr:MAG: hypothetical protein HXK94_002250 [Candidatus Nanogingivalaceae bacterium]QWB91387.1 MAG: hypothetical protein HXK95_002255 [Candidatus Nanogingivalaceae bacterium]
MAQEPLRELTDNLLSLFKEIVASECEEQSQRIDLLEMKVNKIYTFFFESQKLINSILAVEENKEDYQIIQTEKPSELKFDHPKVDNFEESSPIKKDYISRIANIRSRFPEQYLDIVKETKVCIFRKNSKKGLTHTKNTYLPFFTQGSLVSNLSSNDDTSLKSIKRYLRNDEFRYVIIHKKEATDNLLKNIRKLDAEDYFRVLIVQTHKPMYSIFNNIISNRMEADRKRKSK